MSKQTLIGQHPASISNGTAIETVDGRSGINGLRHRHDRWDPLPPVCRRPRAPDAPDADLVGPELETPWRETCGADTTRRIVTELKVESRMRDKDPSAHLFIGHN
jgi:hypothetical protein